MFAFRDSSGAVETAFTDRHGGASTGPYASLNLGAPADAPQEAPQVARNLTLLATALATTSDGQEPSLLTMRQVHGSQVVVATGPDGPPEADALVTTVPGVALLTRAADCVPVLLADTSAGVVGAVHAGRKGLAGGVVEAAIEAMTTLGAEALVAWVGPRVCGRCYEVPDVLRAEVAARAPAAWSTTWADTASLDLGAGVLAVLAERGVPAVDVGGCTVEDDRFFSYRRQGAASGRHAGVIWLRP